MHKHRNNKYCHLKPVTDINTDSKDKIIVTGLMYTCPSPVSPMEEIKRIPCTIHHCQNSSKMNLMNLALYLCDKGS